MELIIKPTGRCNFNCKFCSAGKLDIAHPSDNKVPEKIKELIQEMKPQGIIITGGEPLMVEPEYYYELHELCQCNISPTTNLKGFYLDPDKWTPLFKMDWFHPTTSFNYGETRRWDQNTVFSEKQFIDVINLYREKIGYPPPSFITVIDEDNEDRAVDHVYLAKELGMEAKLNNALAMGFQETTYPRYKLFRHYLKVIELGLEKYEWHCANRHRGICPHNIDLLCQSTIRCCYVDSKNELHCSSCEDEISVGNELPAEEICLKEIKPEQIPLQDFISPECSYCELFRLCNGCKSNRRLSKNIPNYCSEMKKLKDEIIATGWHL